MKAPSKYALRFLGFLAVVGIVTLALSSALTLNTPYLSALSLSPTLIQPAYATQGCPNEVCTPSPRGGFVCTHHGGVACSPNHMTGTCSTTTC